MQSGTTIFCARFVFFTNPGGDGKHATEANEVVSGSVYCGTYTLGDVDMMAALRHPGAAVSFVHVLST